MAADMYIHVLDDYVDAECVMIFKSNHLGSKYFGYNQDERQNNWEHYFEVIESTPSVFVGEVSWLKASLTEDGAMYVPSSVAEVYGIIGEDFPIIDDDLIERVKNAMALPNTTGYQLASANTVVEFLERNKGRQAFTVSW